MPEYQTIHSPILGRQQIRLPQSPLPDHVVMQDFPSYDLAKAAHKSDIDTGRTPLVWECCDLGSPRIGTRIVSAECPHWSYRPLGMVKPSDILYCYPSAIHGAWHTIAGASKAVARLRIGNYLQPNGVVCPISFRVREVQYSPEGWTFGGFYAYTVQEWNAIV